MKKSPLNHCSSDMMHSEAWNSMRKRSVVGKKSPLEMLGVSRKASPLNDMTAQENAAQSEIALTQKGRDSLHDQAMKFGYPFFSSKYGVNVDPEDGVLDVRPVLPEDKMYEGSGGYTLEELENLYPKNEGRKLTYKVEDKPIEDLVKNAYTKRLNEYMGNVGKKKHPMLAAQTEEDARNEFFAESNSTMFNPKTGEIEDLTNSSGDGAISEDELAKVPSHLRNPL